MERKKIYIYIYFVNLSDLHQVGFRLNHQTTPISDQICSQPPEVGPGGALGSWKAQEYLIYFGLFVENPRIYCITVLKQYIRKALRSEES